MGSEYSEKESKIKKLTTLLFFKYYIRLEKTLFINFKYLSTSYILIWNFTFNDLITQKSKLIKYDNLLLRWEFFFIW